MMSDEDFQDLDRFAKIFFGLVAFGVGFVFVVMIAVLALMLPAKARDNGQYAQSPLKGWFDSLKSGNVHCVASSRSGFRSRITNITPRRSGSLLRSI